MMNSILNEARAMGLPVTDRTFRHRVGAVGQYPAEDVGPELRAVTVTYGGQVILRGADGAPTTPSADAAIRNLASRLEQAAREEVVCLWVGHEQAGIGCLLQYDPPASSRAGREAEALRVARLYATPVAT